MSGSMTTQNILQQLYSMNMMNQMQPYMKGTVEQLGNFGDNPLNAFQGLPDFNRYVSETIEQPIQYQLDRGLKDLAHSKEFFSSGHHNRRAQLMNQADTQMAAMTADAMMGQRQGSMTGMESGLARQMRALQQFNQMMGGPISIKGQDPYIKPVDLLSSLFGG